MSRADLYNSLTSHSSSEGRGYQCVITSNSVCSSQKSILWLRNTCNSLQITQTTVLILL